MEEIIDAIKSAENQAEETVRTAKAEARAILADAQKSADGILAAAKAEAATLRENTLKKAEAAADREFSDAIEKGRADGAEFEKKAAKRLDRAAQTIVGSVLNGDR